MWQRPSSIHSHPRPAYPVAALLGCTNIRRSSLHRPGAGLPANARVRAVDPRTHSWRSKTLCSERERRSSPTPLRSRFDASLAAPSSAFPRFPSFPPVVSTPVHGSNAGAHPCKGDRASLHLGCMVNFGSFEGPPLQCTFGTVWNWVGWGGRGRPLPLREASRGAPSIPLVSPGTCTYGTIDAGHAPHRCLLPRNRPPSLLPCLFKTRHDPGLGRAHAQRA